jgi:hypothetical protein
MNRLCVAGLLLLALPPTLTPAADPQAAAPITTPDLCGDWNGYWISCTNGHHGPLHATFTKICDDCYEVRFKGRFAAVVPFRYATTMNVVSRGDGMLILSANKMLGPVLGSFSMTATATATTFDADFTSKNDSGKFVLTRCGR